MDWPVSGLFMYAIRGLSLRIALVYHFTDKWCNDTSYLFNIPRVKKMRTNTSSRGELRKKKKRPFTSTTFGLIWFLYFRFDALTELGAFMRTEFLCISVLRVASGSRVKLASCKSACSLNKFRKENITGVMVLWRDELIVGCIVFS